MELKEPYSLAFGSAGAALFFAYAAKALDKREYFERARLYLLNSVSAMKSGNFPMGFETGALGICWAVEHLRDVAGLETDDIEFFQQENAKLVRWCQSPETGPVLADGIAGLCVYAANAPDSGTGQQLLQTAWRTIRNLAEQTPEGKTWHLSGSAKSELLRVYPGLNFAQRRYSMSVGCGVAGITGALLAVYMSGIRDRELYELIESTVSWMLSNKCGPGQCQSFPMTLGVELPLLSSGWYWGDLGVVMVILNAAYAFGRDDWKNAALETALARINRPGRLNKHSLVHGSIGQAHLCSRIFQLTLQNEFADAALKSYSSALGYRDPKGARGGTMGDGRDYQGLYWGKAGLGLGLLAAVFDAEPCWDRFLFASFRQPTPEYKDEIRASDTVPQVGL